METLEWPPEAAAYLETLGRASRDAGFVPRLQFAEIGASWCAALPAQGPLGTFELLLWTTPAIAPLEQARLWTVRAGPDGGFDLDRGRVATYLYDGAGEIAEHVSYVRHALALADNEPALAMAMRVATDPNQRAQRKAFLERLGLDRRGSKGAPS